MLTGKYILTVFLSMCFNEYKVTMAVRSNGNSYKNEAFLERTDLKPHKKFLNAKKLRRKLGNSFDNEWMSVEDPVFSNRSWTQQYNNIGDSKSRATEQDKELVWTVVASATSDLKPENRSIQSAMTLLQRLTECKTRYEWDDLKELFWPRYVKTGHCVSAVSCSWPPGMFCMNDGFKIMHVLRWRCVFPKHASNNKKGRNRYNGTGIREAYRSSKGLKNSTFKGVPKGMKCGWKKIPFEVIERCKCAC